MGLDVEVSTDNGTADTADDYALSTKVFIPSASSIRSSDYKVGYSYIAVKSISRADSILKRNGSCSRNGRYIGCNF